MEILSFLSDLEENNNREWFAQNRGRYEQSLQEMLQIVTALIERIGEFDPEIRYLSPRDCIYRIYRDTRFSNNKLPYKNHFGAYICKGGRKSPMAGYYIHIQPYGSMFAGGVWCPEPAVLRKMRQAIDVYHPELEEVLNQEPFRKYFGGRLEAFQTLKKVPAGYAKDHPAAELLKKKELFAFYRFNDSLVESEHFIDNMVEAAKALKPFNDWCNDNIFSD